MCSLRATALRCIFAACSLALPASPGGVSAQAPSGSGTTAIVGGYLIDGTEAHPVEDAVVLVEGNRIVAVGTEAEVAIPADARVVDANGYTVMPGLHDTHVHLMIVGHGVYDEFFPRYQDRLDEMMAISARQLLYAGVTSARDLGAPLEESIWIKEQVASGAVDGPRLFVSGPFIQKTTGPTQAIFRWTVDGEDDARAKVRRLVEAGVDVIKVIQADELTPAERRAIREEAERAGLHIAAHGYDAEELAAAIETGARTIEHVNGRPLPRYDEASVKLMAEEGVFSGFTSLVNRIYDITMAYPERLDDQRLKADLPPDVYADVRASIDHPPNLGYFDQKREIGRWHDDKLRQLYDGGVRILVGTDSGTPMNFHYESTWQEMALLVEYGMPPMKVISAATSVPPRLYGLEDELGTIEVGKLADIIVVDGNPLTDMRALKHVVHVMKDGVMYR